MYICQCLYLYCDHCMLSVRRRWYFTFFFNFPTETAEQKLSKFYRKQVFNILHQVCVFRVDQKAMMAALAYDWLETFSTFPLQALNGIGKTCFFIAHLLSKIASLASDWNIRHFLCNIWMEFNQNQQEASTYCTCFKYKAQSLFVFFSSPEP